MDALNKIINYLENSEVPVVKLIQKGLAKSEIWKILNEKGLEPTTEIENLYQVINGTRESNDYLGLQYFFPGYIMCPLEKAIELYQEECIDFESWPEGFIPIFWNGNRNYLLIDCLKDKEGVYFYSPDEYMFDGVVRKYDSIESLFSTVLKCFEEKAYQLSRNLEEIKFGGKTAVKISKEMNPNSEFWDLIEDNLAE